MKCGRRNALWKLPVLWKNQRTVFPQHLEPSVHSSHNADYCWIIFKHNFSCTPDSVSTMTMGVAHCGQRKQASGVGAELVTAGA
jgi:hypothetical protein